MAKQGRWILKNVRHDKPGVTIPSASLGLHSKTINLGSVTSNKKPNITTEIFTDLGVHLNLNNITKNPAEGSTFVQGGLTYKVHWVLTEKPQPEPEPEPVITYRLRITDAPENCLPYNGVAQFDAILEKYIDGVHDELSDLLITSESEWSFISGGDYATRNPAGSNKFIITGNNTTDSVQTVGIKVEYNGQSNVQPATTSVCFNPEEVPVERNIKISTNKIDAVCEDNDLYVVTVTATNVDWTVTVAQNAQSWLSTQDITSDSFKVKVLDFDGARRTGTITVKSTTEGTNISRTITVTQENCEPAAPKLEISISKIDALCKNNQVYSVTVTAENTEWNVTKCNTCSWITISDKTSNSFKISIENSTEDDRTGIVTVASTTPGVNITREITISQPDCIPVPDSITINPDSWTIPCDVSDDTRYHFNITANVEWGFESDAEATYDWIHIVETGETYFELKFDKNDAEDAADRSATITITGGTARATVSITQEKCEEVQPEPETLNITTNDFEVPCETDNTYTISVNASTAWTASTVYDWINITAITSNAIKITVSDNPGGERDGIISAYTTEGGAMAWDYITITQLECEEVETFDVDDSDIHFECNDSMYSLQISATDGVTWTATTSDNRFGIYLGSENPSQRATGTGTDTLHILPLTDNRNVRYDIEGTLRIQSSLGDDVTINMYQAPTPVLEYDGQTQLQFSKNGETKTLTFKTNFDVNVSISQSTNWLSYTKGNLGSTADDGLQIEFSANENPTESQLSATVTISTAYNGNCEKPSNIVIYMYQEEGDPYIPPQPGAYFDVIELYGDFPYYAELGGYTHERSFMDESFYDCCSDFSKGDIGGVAYLMPLRACALQVYYDTNVDLTGLTYQIEHISPANPSQEWLEVVMDPEEYGWSSKDSRGIDYPGDFILIKTRDSFEGSHLYEETYTGYVHIKEKATGNILRTIPVKCIPGDYNAERVSASETETGTLKKRNLELSTTVPASGGTVDVWVYANDSAYISDHPDDDISWNRLSFYYDDGETKIPVTSNDDPQGYIDKIYDTTCNQNGRFHLVVKVGANTSYSNVTRGFELSSENSGYEFIDTDSYCRIKINQERDRIISENNYRIEEFYYVSGDMMPVYDGEGYEASNITGGTCGGNGFTMRPHVSILCDVRRASSPNRITIQEVTNDNRIIFDENKQHYIVNPDVLQSAVTYENGSNWIEVNANYNAQQDTPFEFYIKPNTGYSSVGEARTAIITLTYNRAAQSPRQFRITQEYKQVEQVKVNMLMYSGGSPSVSYVENATGMVDSNGYIIINNQMNQYIHIEGEENVIFTVVPSNSTACTFERIVGNYHRPDGGDSSEIDFYTAYQIDGNGCDLYFNDDAGYGVTYTISINCAKDGRVSRTLTIVVIR